MSGESLDRRRPEVCPRHESLEHDLYKGFERIEKKLDALTKSIEELVKVDSQTAVSLTELRLRVQFLERLTYGAVGLALTSIGLAIMAQVIGK